MYSDLPNRKSTNCPCPIGLTFMRSGRNSRIVLKSKDLIADQRFQFSSFELLRAFKEVCQRRPIKNLVTFIDGESLTEGHGVPVMCNCGYVMLICPPISDEYIECWACGSRIKLLALGNSASDGSVNYPIAYRADGSPMLCDVQGGFHKRVCEHELQEQEILLSTIPQGVKR